VDILPKFDGNQVTDTESNEKQKQSTADVRIKEKARLDEQAAATAKLKAVFEESRRKRLEEQKVAMEQKKIDLEKRKAAAAEALALKNAEINAAVAKRKEEEEKKRLEAEKKRQETLSKGTEALAGALSALQAQPYPMAKKDAPVKKAAKLPTTRPSLQIGRAKDKETGSKPQPATPRPSLRIPGLPKPSPDVKPKVPPPAPRPSFPIPIFGKPSEPANEIKESKPSPPKATPPKPRPSLQIPKLPTTGERDQSKSTSPPTPKPAVSTPKPTPSRPSLQIPKATKAPKGVPTIVAWRVLPSGGISGQIFGSINFKEGERIETSTIATGTLENGSVVTTASGSRYFLSAESVRDMRAAAAAAAAKSAPKVVPDAPSSPPRATLQLTKLAKERDAKAAELALRAASQSPTGTMRRRPTFSLSAFFGFDKTSQSDEGSSKSTVTTASTKSTAPLPSKGSTPLNKVAPKGVPAINRWKQNRDKSITGIITGSSAFPDGERITTSPIAGGLVRSGQIVTTSSGTKYFLQ
jgi:hypothetical protein